MLRLQAQDQVIPWSRLAGGPASVLVLVMRIGVCAADAERCYVLAPAVCAADAERCYVLASAVCAADAERYYVLASGACAADAERYYVLASEACAVNVKRYYVLAWAVFSKLWRVRRRLKSFNTYFMLNQ